ncbi:MAG TPA: site-specific integrase [Mucilaginibacter sp.]|nr:site-specific integrase [Mucilaginibacter sp.]
MVHLKVVLDTRRKKSDGTYPITFRITNVKQVHVLPAGISINEFDWDQNRLNIKSTHPNANILNVGLSKRFYEIQKTILQIEEAGAFSFEQLKACLELKPTKPEVEATFKRFADQVVGDMLLVKRTGNALIYKTAINRLLDFANNPKLTFHDMDFTFLDRFQNKLLQDGASKNTIGNYLRSIRAIYNKAIKAKIVSRDLYPFNEISIKSEKTAKRAIEVEQINKIFKFEIKVNSQDWHAHNYFFLSFALRGMSFTDMAYLKPENLNCGYLTYRRRKTKKIYTIKIEPVANNILKHYINTNANYLLPILPTDVAEDSEEAIKRTRQWIKTTNKYLNRIASNCNIRSNITTYVTRHTWATLAKKKLGYSNEIIAECLGHEYGNKITNIYLDSFDQSLIDEVNERVIGLINN